MADADKPYLQNELGTLPAGADVWVVYARDSVGLSVARVTKTVGKKIKWTSHDPQHKFYEWCNWPKAEAAFRTKAAAWREVRRRLAAWVDEVEYVLSQEVA